jgi:hypothetical protein
MMASRGCNLVVTKIETRPKAWAPGTTAPRDVLTPPNSPRLPESSRVQHSVQSDLVRHTAKLLQSLIIYNFRFAGEESHIETDEEYEKRMKTHVDLKSSFDVTMNMTKDQARRETLARPYHEVCTRLVFLYRDMIPRVDPRASKTHTYSNSYDLVRIHHRVTELMYLMDFCNILIAEASRALFS